MLRDDGCSAQPSLCLMLRLRLTFNFTLLDHESGAADLPSPGRVGTPHSMQPAWPVRKTKIWTVLYCHHRVFGRRADRGHGTLILRTVGVFGR